MRTAPKDRQSSPGIASEPDQATEIAPKAPKALGRRCLAPKGSSQPLPAFQTPAPRISTL